ncbi:MAG: YceI family protein [Limisphaerales bacterium]
MKNTTCLALLASLLTLSLNGVGAEMLKYRGKPGSKMRMEGTSTIHDWWSESVLVSGRLELDPSFPTDPAKTDIKPGPVPAEATITIFARTFQCQWGAPMNAVMLESLDADKHPKLEFKLKELVFKEAKDGDLVFDSKGDLTVRGKTKEIAMPVQIQRVDPKKLKVKGAVEVKMSDFDIPAPAPKVALGAIKTADEVKLSFEWNAEMQAPAATP